MAKIEYLKNTPKTLNKDKQIKITINTLNFYYLKSD